MKYLKIGPYGIGAFVIILGAALLRIMLIAQGWPVLNSDEATMGLMALHIAYRGERPNFFYGQNYMGSFEAYLGAALFHPLGPSLFALRLGLVLLFALFLLSMYLLVSMLYTKKFALVSLVLLALGAGSAVKWELVAIGGYPETLACGALLLFLACWLALSSGRAFSPRERVWRFLVYAAWGLVAGFALWSDLLVFPFVFISALLLLLFCLSELRTWATLFLLAGFLSGVYPLLQYNLSPHVGGTLTTLLHIQHGGPSGDALKHLPIVQQFVGTFLVALPMATSSFPACMGNDLPLQGSWGSHVVQCALYHGAGIWSAGFIVLTLVAIFLALRTIWEHRRRSSGEDRAPGERQTLVQNTARLAVLCCAVLLLIFYVISPVAALDPWTSYRYLFPLLIVMPAVLWPLWGGIITIKPLKAASNAAWTRLPTRPEPAGGKMSGAALGRDSRSPAQAASVTWPNGKPSLAGFVKGLAQPVLRWGALLLVALAFASGMLGTFEGLPQVRVADQQQQDLIHNLLRIGATRIYSEYWTCNTVIFLSHERIICAVLDDLLNPGFDRYLPYRAIVKTVPFPTYISPIIGPHSRQSKALIRFMQSRKGQYRRYVFDGYVVYQRLTG